jgi:hypothetical protein
MADAAHLATRLHRAELDVPFATAASQPNHRRDHTRHEASAFAALLLLLGLSHHPRSIDIENYFQYHFSNPLKRPAAPSPVPKPLTPDIDSELT